MLRKDEHFTPILHVRILNLRWCNWKYPVLQQGQRQDLNLVFQTPRRSTFPYNLLFYIRGSWYRINKYVLNALTWSYFVIEFLHVNDSIGGRDCGKLLAGIQGNREHRALLLLLVNHRRFWKKGNIPSLRIVKREKQLHNHWIT